MRRNLRIEGRRARAVGAGHVGRHPHGARVDHAKLGLPAVAVPASIFVSIELERQDCGAFDRAVRRSDEVMKRYLRTGSRGILLRLVAADLAAFDRFVEGSLMQMPGIRNVRSNIALRTMVKRDVRPRGAG